MTPRPRVLVGLALAALSFVFLLSIASSAQAQSQQPGFGGIVGDLGADAEHVVSTSGGPTDVSFRDSDGNGNLNGDEGAYLVASSPTSSGDVRLADALGGDSFTRIQAGDSDSGLEVQSLSGTIRFFDANHDESISSGDTVYYDLDQTTNGKVSSNDLILTGQDAGDKVTSSHENIGFALKEPDTSPRFGFYDEDDNGDYDGGEAAVVDVDADGRLTVGDIRLGDTSGGLGGTIAGQADDDVTYVLDDFSGTWEFRHRDPDGDGSFDPNENAYISKGDDVATFAVRIGNPPDGYQAGTKVIEQDSDWGIATKQISGSLSYVDNNGNGNFDQNDRLYYDLSDSGSSEVSRGDIVLSGSNAGQLVGGGSSDTGTALTSYDGSLRYFDTDGNDNYGADIVYADTNNDNIVKSYDVQLSDARDPYASDDDTTPATIEITSPSADAEVTVNETTLVEGTADGGDAEVDEVTLEATGGAHSIANVTGTRNWTAEFTPEEAGEFELTATAVPSSGDEATASLTLTVVETKDGDDDGVPDGEDNCPGEANPDQADRDEDGTGDTCDEDTDGDGIADRVDECPTEPGQPADSGCPADDGGDTDGNQTDGNQTDGGEETPDADGDGVADREDNCPQTRNTEQADADGDGVGDACDENEEGVPAPGASLAVAVMAIGALAVRRNRR